MFISDFLKRLPIVTASVTIAFLGTGFFRSNQLTAATLFVNRTLFESQLSNLIIDDYESASYLTGDTFDGKTLDIHTNASMNRVLGETQYETTQFNNHNLIVSRSSGHRYCAGCNGSFSLDFTQTSISDSLGIFGAGFDIFSSLNYVARVIFGDGSNKSFSFASTASNFWGITSAKGIEKIHFDTDSNLPQSNNDFVEIDNLTLGSSAVPPLEENEVANPQTVPEPASTLGLFLLGGWGVGSTLKRQQARKV